MLLAKSKLQFQSILTDLIKLYQNEPLTILFNDMVSIGTWPTPERSKFKNTKGSVAIDSVPLPEKIKELKMLINKLLEVNGDIKLKDLL